MLDTLRRLAPAVLRHLLAYGDLLGEESIDALRQLRKQVIGILIAVLTGTMAVALGCAWAIAAAWDGPHRLTVIGALCIGFVLITALACLYVMTEPPNGRQPFDRLAAEWQADRRMLATLDPSFFAATRSASLE